MRRKLLLRSCVPSDLCHVHTYHTSVTWMNLPYNGSVIMYSSFSSQSVTWVHANVSCQQITQTDNLRKCQRLVPLPSLLLLFILSTSPPLALFVAT